MITGGAGGIGSTLALLLTKRGHKVNAVDNFNNGYMENLIEDGKQICDVTPLDIRETQQLVELIDFDKTDVIIHLAALTSLPECESDPAECLSVNVAGTASVLHAARLRNKKVIVASTSAIYERNDKVDAPFTEYIEVNPRLMYPLSKKMMEDLIQSYIKNYDMDITTLRFFNVFGPRQDIHRKSPPLINFIVREIAANRPITFFSNGEQQRDYIHVDDVVSMIEACIGNPTAKQQTFNLCTGTLTSVKDIIGYAEKAFEMKLEHNFEQPKEYWSNYSILKEGKPLKDSVLEHEVNKFSLGSRIKAEKLLSWKPNLHIEELMIDTMRKNYELYTKN
jgi:nucleoside-diphosphate-sugar epimerase